MHELLLRWKAPLNLFWKRAVRLFVSMLAAGLSGIILTASLEDQIKKDLPPLLDTIFTYMLIAGIIGFVCSKLTCDDPSSLQKNEKADNNTPGPEQL